MNRWWWVAGALMLAGCANSGYRYDDDGYWTGSPARSSVVVTMGWGFGGCSGWSGFYGHPYYGYGYGYPYGHGWLPCGYGYGYGYGYGGWYGAGIGYWRDPRWSHPWYLPPRDFDARPAGARARQMAGYPADSRDGIQRYEDLAPSRRRDPGGGDRAWTGSGGRPGAAPGMILVPSPQGGIGSGTRGTPSYGYPTPPQGLSSGRFDSGSSRSGPSPSSWGSPPSPSMRSGAQDASPRGSAAGAARSVSRETRDEE